MKKLAMSVAVLVALAAALPAAADLSDEVKMTVDVILEHEDELVLDNLSLTPEEKESFLPLFREYQTELDKVMANRISLIKRYMEGHDSISESDAQALIEKFFVQTDMKTTLRKSYAEKFLAVLPATKVARLVQIENKIQALVDLKLAESIPLINESGK